MKKLIFLLAGIIMIYGCASIRPINYGERMNNLNVGMTKKEALEIMGPPMNTSANADIEYMLYPAPNNVTAVSVPVTDRNGLIHQRNSYVATETPPYFIRFKNGKLESYGRVGDFDSSKPPEQKETIDLNINK